MRRLVSFTLLCWLGSLPSLLAAADSSMPKLSSFIDLNGQVHDLRQNDKQKVRAFVFLSIECRVSNSYTQTLNALHRRLRGTVERALLPVANASRRAGVPVLPDNEKAELFAVVSDNTIARRKTADHFREFKADEQSEVTFSRDITPVIYSRCLNCHRKGQVAPFELATYEQVAKRADWIASVTEDRIMPPWIPHVPESSSTVQVETAQTTAQTSRLE